MAPIYDSDLAESRWREAEWQNFELWEELERRFRRRRRLWIAATAALFVCLLSIPPVLEWLPRWQAMGLARSLASELGDLKRDVAQSRQAVRLRFEAGTLRYVIERAPSCDHAGAWASVRRGELGSAEQVEQYRVLRPSEARELGLVRVRDQLCFDPLRGHVDPELSGFALLTAKDLTVGRLDRAALVVLSGPSALLAFE